MTDFPWIDSHFTDALAGTPSSDLSGKGARRHGQFGSPCRDQVPASAGHGGDADDCWLVGGLVTIFCFIFRYVGFLIIPTVIFFRGTENG